MKADQLLSDRQRVELEFNANHSTMRSEIRDGKPVLVDVYKYGPNKGKEVVIPDYASMVNNRRSRKLDRRDRTPTLFEQFVLVVGMLGAAIVIYFWVIGL